MSGAVSNISLSSPNANYTVSRPGCAFNATTLRSEEVTIVSVYTSAGALVSSTVVDKNGAVFSTAGYTVYEGPCGEYKEMVPTCFTVNAGPLIIRRGFKTVFHDLATGTYTVIDYVEDDPYSTFGTTVYTPAQVSETKCEYQGVFSQILCDNNGSFARHYYIAQDGNINWVRDTTLSMIAAYVPVGTVKVCASLRDPETLTLCDNNGTFRCKCTTTNAIIDSTIVRQTGAGAQGIASAARSVSVIVLAGNPTVSIGGGPAVTLAAGVSLQWGVDNGGTSGEALQDAFTFTGVAGSDFIVITTREI